nr:MAG TPA: hypothetical protein [Caudoviricetes sp.]
MNIKRSDNYVLRRMRRKQPTPKGGFLSREYVGNRKGDRQVHSILLHIWKNTTKCIT